MLVIVAFACGGKPKGPPLSPLPPDKPDEPEKPDAGPVAPVEPPARPVPTGPLEVKVTPATPTVKLLKPGTGKRVALRLTPKQGAKQSVELALDFGVTQSVGTDSQSDIVPTVVLAGSAEAAGVDKDGAVDYVLTIDKTDAREVEGAKVPMDKFREVVASTVGLKLGGTVKANGATGEVTMRIEKQGEATGQVLDLVRLTLPAWPAFPAEPIAPGAKWSATSTTKLADRLDVTAVTEYELVSYKNAIWTIKSRTKLSGVDQMMQGGKITKIAGSGSSEITLTDGALFPTHKTKLEATFTASEVDPKAGENPAKLDFKIQIGGAITAK